MRQPSKPRSTLDKHKTLLLNRGFNWRCPKQVSLLQVDYELKLLQDTHTPHSWMVMI